MICYVTCVRCSTILESYLIPYKTKLTGFSGDKVICLDMVDDMNDLVA
ncbi:DUF6392 family protein [Photorhabdus tasmaniensis]